MDKAREQDIGINKGWSKEDQYIDIVVQKVYKKIKWMRIYTILHENILDACYWLYYK